MAILSVLEISLSFDNAVVNAGILKKMNAFWQKIFLTVGVLIAVFGMRLVFPVVIVAISAKLGPIEAVDLALNDKDHYQELVTDAHPAIAAFGGMFLLMIFLDFIFEDRDIKWLGWLERPLAKLGKVDMLSVCIALDRAADHRDDLRDPRPPARRHARRQGGDGPALRRRRSDHLPDRRRPLRLLRGQARRGGGTRARGGGRGRARAASPGPRSPWPARPRSSCSSTWRSWTRPSPSTA